MDEIPTWIEQLHSLNKDKRYEACEYLRLSPGLQQAALDALERATHDPDPDVADAAARALALHVASAEPVPPDALFGEPVLAHRVSPGLGGVLGLAALSYLGTTYASGVFNASGAGAGLAGVLCCLPSLLLALFGAWIVGLTARKPVLRIAGALCAGITTGLSPWLYLVLFPLTP